jgi:hypothetical protein
MSISTNSFIRGGANQKNLQWLQAVACDPGVNGYDAIKLAVELTRFDDDTIFSSVQSITDQTGLTTTTSIAGLWSLREAGHIDLQMIDGEQFSCRRLLNGGR